MFWPPLLPRTGAAVLLLLAPLTCLSAMAAGIAIAVCARSPVAGPIPPSCSCSAACSRWPRSW